MKKLTALLLSLAMILSLSACAENEAPQTSEENTQAKDIVAVTIIPEKAFVEAVAGDELEVTAMVPPGSSPENYEPSPMEMEKLSNAKVFFSIGVAVENSKTFKTLSEKIEVVDLSAKVDEKFPPLEIDGGRDPHIWLSPERSSYMVEIIADVLGEMYPEKKDTFKANGDNYIAKIKGAADEVRESLKDKKDATFICFHPAFNYFADEFNLTMLALEKHGKEATPLELKEIIDIAKEKGVKTVFTQAETDSRQASAFAEEIGAEIVVLDPLSENYVENLKIMAEAFKA